ncbi:MAG: CSLREA domain-containing protein [Thermoanaerobaculia bacterium]
MKQRSIALCAVVVFLSPAAIAATFVVNTTDDVFDGVCDAVHCSLREAIGESNNTPGPDLITFSIPGAPPHVIQPPLPMPSIVDPVTVDGTTQPGASSGPIVELDGSTAPTGVNIRGLTFSGASHGSAVRGLVIRGWSGPGIETFSNGHTIEGNYLGTDVTGTAAHGNSVGVSLRSSGNIVLRNVISGNRFGGALVSPSSINPVADGNTLRGNHIGVDPTGTIAVPNVGNGVSFSRSGNNTVGGTTAADRNIISANKGSGVVTNSGTAGCGSHVGNVIQGNFIGLDASGSTALGNLGEGVQAFGPGTSIGTIGAGNVISANAVGINVGFCPGTVIQGNRIGTDATGMSARSNVVGVDLQGDALVGGTVPGAANQISGNGYAQIILERGFSTIQGNLIGTEATGNGPVPNGNMGIVVSDLAIGGLLGGTAAGAGNVVAFHPQDGVQVRVGTLTVLSNSIHDNGHLGINLKNDSVTLNDLGDSDAGPNALQNFPVLSMAETGGHTTITGTFNSAAGQTFRIELFDNPSCGPLGHGQGRTLVAAGDVTTDAGGNTAFAFIPASPIPPGRIVTATATDPAGNTSEFSACLQVIAAVDTTAPVIHLTLLTDQLWPPNHKMVKVASGVSATDDQDPSPSLAVTVTSNEPADGSGDGTTAPDWEVTDNHDGTFDVWLRAERSGTGNGRTYTISATASDDAGNPTTETATATVPKSQKNN